MYRFILVCIVLSWEYYMADSAIILSIPKDSESHHLLAEMSRQPFNGLANNCPNLPHNNPFRFLWIVLITYCSLRLPRCGYLWSPCSYKSNSPTPHFATLLQLTIGFLMSFMLHSCGQSTNAWSYSLYSLCLLWHHPWEKLSQAFPYCKWAGPWSWASN